VRLFHQRPSPEMSGQTESCHDGRGDRLYGLSRALKILSELFNSELINIE
jgi:hypothetical protein